MPCSPHLLRIRSVDGCLISGPGHREPRKIWTYRVVRTNALNGPFGPYRPIGQCSEPTCVAAVAPERSRALTATRESSPMTSINTPDSNLKPSRDGGSPALRRSLIAGLLAVGLIGGGAAV